MGIITMVMLGLTVIGLGLGALFGFMRGRNRSVLRLILVAVCVLLAVLLRKPLTNLVMGIEVEGQPIKETLMATFNQGETALPESVQTLIFSIIEIFLGVIAYFIVFFTLRAVTWAVVFPICKIFVRKGEKKRRGYGALVGLAQGVLVVFAVLMPLNGLITQVDKISNIKMQDKPLFELPAEVGLQEYVNGPMSKTYTAFGGWYFNTLTSADKLNFDDITDMVEVVGGLANSITGITESMDVLQKEEATTQEKSEALTDVGNKLIEVGEKIEDLSDDAKQQVNDMLSDVKDMISGEGSSPEMEEFFNDLNIEDIDVAGMGHALVGASSIMEKQETGEPINQEDVTHIVTGLATNMKIVDMITGEEGETPTLVNNLDDEQKTMFENAIAEQELSAEDEQTLRKLLGLIDTNVGE